MQQKLQQRQRKSSFSLTQGSSPLQQSTFEQEQKDIKPNLEQHIKEHNYKQKGLEMSDYVDLEKVYEQKDLHFPQKDFESLPDYDSDYNPNYYPPGYPAEMEYIGSQMKPKDQITLYGDDPEQQRQKVAKKEIMKGIIKQQQKRNKKLDEEHFYKQFDLRVNEAKTFIAFLNQKKLTESMFDLWRYTKAFANKFLKSFEEVRNFLDEVNKINGLNSDFFGKQSADYLQQRFGHQGLIEPDL